MRRVLTVILSALFILSLQVSPSQASHSFNNGSHWPGGPGKGFVMVSDRSGGTVGNVNKAIAVWNQAGAYNIVNVGPVCPNTFAPHYCLTIYASNNLQANNGYTQTHVFAGNHILAADVYISPRATFGSEVQDNLLIHEMGHGLGLQHREDSSSSVMKPLVYDFYSPDAHDFEQLRINRA